MKIFSIRRALGFTALYAMARYAKKHGGVRKAFDNFLSRAKDASEGIGKAHSPSERFDTSTYASSDPLDRARDFDTNNRR